MGCDKTQNVHINYLSISVLTGSELLCSEVPLGGWVWLIWKSGFVNGYSGVGMLFEYAIPPAGDMWVHLQLC